MLDAADGLRVERGGLIAVMFVSRFVGSVIGAKIHMMCDGLRPERLSCGLCRESVWRLVLSALRLLNPVLEFAEQLLRQEWARPRHPPSAKSRRSSKRHLVAESRASILSFIATICLPVGTHARVVPTEF